MRTELEGLRTRVRGDSAVIFCRDTSHSSRLTGRHIKYANHNLLSSRVPGKMAETSKNPTRPSQRKKTAAMTPRLQSYVGQSLTELTERLLKFSKEEKGHTLSSKTRDIVYVLKVHKLRHSCNAHAFCDGRGVECLMSLLSLCVQREGRDRGLLLATLANLCALHSGCRDKVISRGLTEIASALAQTSCPASLCTMARLIANLALNPHNIPRLLEVGVVRDLSHTLFFQTASDSASRLSVLRALRVLGGGDARCREEMKTSEGVPGLVDCLKSTDAPVSESALQTLHVLLQDRDMDVVQGLVSGKALSQVVRLCGHRERGVAERAVEVLVWCAGVSEGRVGLNSAGGVECLLGQLDSLDPTSSSSSSSSLFPAVVSALCASCRDVLGRQRMRDSGGLDRLIQMLSSAQQASLHPDILSALVCYYFDEHSLKFMVKGLGLLRALAYHLHQMTRPLEEVREDAATGSVENESPECSPPSCQSSCKDSPVLSGFETTASRDSSSPQTASPNQGEDSLTSGSPPSSLPSSPSSPPSSPPSWSSPSCPSSFSSSGAPLPKRPRLSTDMDFSHPMPANFIDSLLSSPSPYSTPCRKPGTPLPPDHPPTSLESHVVQLLSRVSHLRDCLPHLASPDLLLAMLGCFLSSPSFSRHTHIFKTLARVFSSPHCFQEVISCYIPSRLQQQLALTPPSSPPSTSTSSSTTVDLLDLPSPLPTLSSPPSLSSPTLCHTPSHTLGYMCRELLSHLSRVGQSPYGQGVLAHLLLAGEDRDKTASALAAPLLCSVPRVCRKLMVEYGGQARLAQLLISPTSSSSSSSSSSPTSSSSPMSSLREWAADSLLALSATSDLHSCKHTLSGCLTPCLLASPEFSLTPCLAGGTACKQTCLYRDYDHYPFDYEILLHQNGMGTMGHGTGTELTVHLPAHRAVLMEASEVFCVMLGGHFLESAKSEVYLQNIHPHTFRSVLHHLYGCGWQCEEVLHHITPDEYQLHDHKDISTSIISAVSSNFDLPHKKLEVWHTLCCLATASQFLLATLQGVCEMKAALLISQTTVVPLFLFSQLHGSCWLAERCVRHVMCSGSDRPSLQHRASLLELANCSQGDTVLDMVQRLISTQLLHSSS